MSRVLSPAIRLSPVNLQVGLGSRILRLGGWDGLGFGIQGSGFRV